MGMGQNKGLMKFVYFCTIALFVGRAFFGYRSMYARKDRISIVVALLIFGTISVMNPDALLLLKPMVIIVLLKEM